MHHRHLFDSSFVPVSLPLLPGRYVCLVQKGYQETEVVVSSVVTKVKGYTATNTSALGLHVWDVTEYIIPPQVCL